MDRAPLGPREHDWLMNPLIRRTFRLWFCHQQDSVKRGAEVSNSRDIADKAGNYNSVDKDTFALGITGNLAGYAERNFANAVEESKEGRVLEINKRGISACNCGNLACDARNIFDDRFLGFVGNDGVPWLCGRAAKNAGFLSRSRVELMPPRRAGPVLRAAFGRPAVRRLSVKPRSQFEN